MIAPLYTCADQYSATHLRVISTELRIFFSCETFLFLALSLETLPSLNTQLHLLNLGRLPGSAWVPPSALQPGNSPGSGPRKLRGPPQWFPVSQGSLFFTADIWCLQNHFFIYLSHLLVVSGGNVNHIPLLNLHRKWTWIILLKFLFPNKSYILLSSHSISLSRKSFPHLFSHLQLLPLRFDPATIPLTPWSLSCILKQK